MISIHLGGVVVDLNPPVIFKKKKKVTQNFTLPLWIDLCGHAETFWRLWKNTATLYMYICQKNIRSSISSTAKGRTWLHLFISISDFTRSSLKVPIISSQTKCCPQSFFFFIFLAMMEFSVFLAAWEAIRAPQGSRRKPSESRRRRWGSYPLKKFLYFAGKKDIGPIKLGLHTWKMRNCNLSVLCCVFLCLKTLWSTVYIHKTTLATGGIEHHQSTGLTLCSQMLIKLKLLAMLSQEPITREISSVQAFALSFSALVFGWTSGGIQPVATLSVTVYWNLVPVCSCTFPWHYLCHQLSIHSKPNWQSFRNKGDTVSNRHTCNIPNRDQCRMHVVTCQRSLDNLHQVAWKQWTLDLLLKEVKTNCKRTWKLL